MISNLKLNPRIHQHSFHAPEFKVSLATGLNRSIEYRAVLT